MCKSSSKGTLSTFSQHRLYYDAFPKEDAARKALEESENSFRSLAEEAGDGIIIASGNGRVLFVNHRLEEITGYSFDELNRAEVHKLLFSVEELEKIRQNALKRAEGRDAPHQYRSYLRRKNNGTVPIELTAALIRWRGEPASLAIVRDISENLRTARALEKSEAKYRGLYENLRDGCVAFDKSGRITEFNPAFQEMLGYKASEFTSLTHEEITPIKWRGTEAQIIEKQVFRRGYSEVYEKELIKKDGTCFPAEMQMYLIKDDAGETDGMWAFVRDITERRTMEQQIRQAEKMEAIGQLAGGIAHDFNNQLSGIMGCADLLCKKLRDNDNLYHFAQNILLGTKRAADLTNQLLAFARKGKYLTVPVNIHDIIAEVVSLLERSIDKRVRIEELLNAEVSITVGDPTQLQNALLNLAINASDAMPDGGVLCFSTDNVLLDDKQCLKTPYDIVPGRYLRVSVSDTGCGIDSKMRHRMFEPFFTTKAPGKGTGLGLAAVFGTMKSHKGKIDVSSRANEGTTITLYLPLAAEVSKEKVANDPPRLQPTVETSRRIILIDDEEIVQSAVSFMLEGMGHSVRAFASGEDALAYYTENWQDIDLVILDVMMPKMSGKDILEAMKVINENIVVLVCSGYSVEGQAARMLESGAKGFIQKPCTQDALIREIERLFPAE